MILEPPTERRRGRTKAIARVCKIRDEAVSGHGVMMPSPPLGARVLSE
jgi:hypothetical protein